MPDSNMKTIIVPLVKNKTGNMSDTDRLILLQPHPNTGVGFIVQNMALNILSYLI